MMIALIELLGGLRATAFAALCVALSATLAVQSYRLGSAQDEVEEQQASLTVFHETQQVNLSTIDELRETNKAWALKCALDPKAASDAAQATEQSHGALNGDDTRRADDRERDYAVDQNAAAWGDVRVPVALLSRLRR